MNPSVIIARMNPHPEVSGFVECRFQWEAQMPIIKGGKTGGLPEKSVRHETPSDEANKSLLVRSACLSCVALSNHGFILPFLLFVQHLPNL